MSILPIGQTTTADASSTKAAFTAAAPAASTPSVSSSASVPQTTGQQGQPATEPGASPTAPVSLYLPGGALGLGAATHAPSAKPTAAGDAAAGASVAATANPAYAASLAQVAALQTTLPALLREPGSTSLSAGVSRFDALA